mmetsp:Transcript_6945/g.8832  ORF Transcript_6945/g.8832 Transcript_6945/m.8832 type:complete len:406 (-) Transcript_6945:40-1257(-)|eukprot:CAMPEP_0197327524 /NCGR_PEP_ID=MMETSP0892-20130614/2961_1 /TAXON_ID=44058 ORGANISM="Aureoumbra lagunensis, Strain CCMP1510" /NCGR_SAMPLE_ID=MMETSP0892 /ASSEMBLY_ACC=CAM_ASM_000538 /LENGTH=405 /DNA_ID=CAMNT_0042822417 /DNA_START=48 /DNA_END=1265 /DNA_ORIENTATION=+
MTALYRHRNEDVEIWKRRAETAEAEVEQLKKKIEDLEGELDILASRVASVTTLSEQTVSDDTDQGKLFANYEKLQEHDKTKVLMSIPRTTLKGASGGSNCLAVAQRSINAVAVSGADSTVRLLANDDGPDINFYELWNTKLTAPAIVLRWNPEKSLLVATTMDGRTHFLSADQGSILASHKYHDKFVVDAAWSPDGTVLATCARDKTVVLYRKEDSLCTPFQKFKSFELPASAECLCFTQQNELIIAVRGEPFLRYIDLDTLSELRISLNDNPADTHVSFDVLHLAPSPDDTFLAVATTKNQHIVYKLRDHHHIRILVGHSSDDFANTKLAWLGDDSNLSLVSNSNNDCALYQWDVASAKLLSKIPRAHNQPVRNLDVFESTYLATASFDKSVKLWSLQDDNARI